MSPKLSGPFHPPAAGGRPEQAVVLMHGYGADGTDLIGVAPLLARMLPHAVFYAPNAPEPCEVWASGRQWFSLDAYDPEAIRRDPTRMGQAHETMLAGARRVAPLVDGFLDDVLAMHDLAADRLALVGFSQGTMMALHVALRRPQPVACVLGYSGALLGAAALPADIRSRPPVLLVHGAADEVVPPQASEAAEVALRRAGIEVTAHIRPGLPHGIDDVGVEIGGRFLAAWLLGG